ncbi:MAG: DNA repair protein RecN, partial [Chloroflexota bacterium]|nr:DNA repair protein RecN [Chloroflexota bacterium]
MLLELRVKGLGIIEEINWSLGQGLNVITGETGAGKSLVIDAVEALLAGRVDEAVIRHGDEAARIEGVFAVTHNLAQLKKLLAEKGLDGGETLVINGEFRRQGRSVVRVNGTAVPRAVLHQLGRCLIDVHGQSEHLSLLDKKYQLDFLDTYAHSLALRDSFNARMTELAKTEQEIKALIDAEKDLARRQEFLRFQIEEISRARLRDGEEEELERERNLLTFSEKLKALSYGAYQALQGEDISEPAALAGLNKAVQMMKKLVEIDPALKAQLGFLEETFYGLDEAARDIRAYHDRLEYDPKRLEEVESRLELIRSLKKKYGDSIAEILNYLEKAQTNLDGFVHSSERRAGLEQTCAALKQEMGRLASELSQKRVRASKKLVAQVKKELRDLNMSQVEFEVSISRVNAADGIPLP